MNEWSEAEHRVERALQFTETHQWAEALAELDAALQIIPNDALWHAQRGQILDQLERYHEAVESYVQAAELEPDHVGYRTALAIDLIRTDRFADAIELLERVARAHPGHEPAYCHRIAAYTRLGDHDRAEEMFYLAQQIQPDCPNCFHHMAESLACRGEFQRAVYCWERALEIEPDYPHARQRIAEAHRASMQLDKAHEHYLSAYRNDPGNTDILGDLGDLLIEMGRLSDAAAKFQMLVELDPESVRGHVMRGLIASRLDDLDLAAHAFTRGLELDEEHPGLRTHLGEVELRRGKHYDALRHLSLAIEDDPDDTIARMAMGNCLLELGRSREAAEHYEHVIALEPTIAGTFHNLAVCQFLESDFDAGIRHCLQALELEPENLMVIHKLALAYLHRGQWRDARRMIRLGLGIDPTHGGLTALPRRFIGLRLRHLLHRITHRLSRRHH